MSERCWQERPSLLALQGQLIKDVDAHQDDSAQSTDPARWYFVSSSPVCFEPNVLDDSGQLIRVDRFSLQGFSLSESFVYLIENGVVENRFFLIASPRDLELGPQGATLNLELSSLVSVDSEIEIYTDEAAEAVFKDHWFGEAEELSMMLEPEAAGNGGGGEDPLPADTDNVPSFPWPPPKASTTDNLPYAFFAGSERLGDVEKRLNSALDNGGYYEKSFYPVPGGFAVATRMEQIDKAGKPRPDQTRWSLSDDLGSNFSLVRYLRKLFTADPGHFRVIVFIVTEESVEMSDEEASRAEALRWLDEGWKNKLPAYLADQPFTEDHGCVSLVYEFEVLKVGDPRFVTPSPLPGRHHLKTTQLWETLEQTP